VNPSATPAAAVDALHSQYAERPRADDHHDSDEHTTRCVIGFGVAREEDTASGHTIATSRTAIFLITMPSSHLHMRPTSTLHRKVGNWRSCRKGIPLVVLGFFSQTPLTHLGRDQVCYSSWYLDLS
jgi:hypothetical protein